jgi:hypothetical protein
MLSFGGLIGSTLADTVFLYDLGTRKLCHQVKATLPVALKRSMVEVIIYQNEIRLFSRERSSTGSNDCFVVVVLVVVVVVVVGIFIL